MQECPLYSEPELYDLLFPNAGQSTYVGDAARTQRLAASEQFYVEEARNCGGRVLELACGSGRLTIPIAQAGVEIIAVDLSTAMLDTARAKASAAGVRLQFVQADMRSFDLPGQFSAILIPGNSLLHLFTVEDLKQCLRSVHRHLAVGGRLVFDVSNPDMRRLARDPGQRYPVLRVDNPQCGEISLEETVDYDTAAQVQHIRWYVSAPGRPDFRVIDYDLRVIFPQELRLLLEASSFHLETRYGEVSREPFASSSPRQVCVCAAL